MALKKILTEKKYSLVLALPYLAWALTYIYNSSYVASDGRRYFNLFDDAMISMRYAWNFAHGNGLVWNIGERVEGYTNLLMTLLMSGAAFFFEKRYAVLIIQLLGIGFVLGAALLSARIHQTLKNAATPAPLPFLLVLLYYPLNFWSLMGMETGLLALTLGTGVYASLQYEKQRAAKYLWLMSAAFGLAHLTRNESVLFAALAFLYLLPATWHNRQAFTSFLFAGLFYSAFVAAQLIFRYAYYGALVPNTYTLKLVGMTLADRLHNGWGFIQPYLIESSLIILLAVAGVLYRPAKIKTYLLSFFVVAVLYQIYVGGDSWNYWRIMSPTLPLLFALMTRAAEDLSMWVNIRARRVAPLLLLLTCLLVANLRFLPEIFLRATPYQNNYARAHVEVAIALQALTDEDATIGVYWGGTLPYYLDRYAIDFLGKSDSYIAQLPPDMSGQSAGFGMTSIPGHNKHDLDYSIKKLLPTYVEEFDYGVEKLSAWGQVHYVRVKYGESKLYLLKESPHVHWHKVKNYLQW